MPSPFPGMDPYVEGPEWESFHAAFMIDLADALSPDLPSRYVVRPQRRVYVEHTFSRDSDAEMMVADFAVLRPTAAATFSRTAVAGAPHPSDTVDVVLTMPETRYETYLTVRDAKTRQVVTVIELLSPANKRAGSGRRKYLRKREEVLKTRTNLIELDLLRGGRRIPTVTPLPPGDYFVISSRAGFRPIAQVKSWTIRDRLPSIMVPLEGDETDVPLDLQPVFTSRYDRAKYSQTLEYSAAIKPPLREGDAEWVAELLKSKRTATR